MWLERETMEQAYELQQADAGSSSGRFLNPLEGGSGRTGLGDRRAAARQPRLPGLPSEPALERSGITRMVMTALADGREVPVDAQLL